MILSRLHSLPPPLPPVHAVEWDSIPSNIMTFAARADADKWAIEATEVSERIRNMLGLQDNPFVLMPARRVPGGFAVGLKARHINGWLSIGGRQISILPKFVQIGTPEASEQLFVRLLAYSTSTRQALFGRTPARVSDFSNPIDFLARAYIDALEGAISHGLPMGYGQIDDDLPYLRGRLLTSRLYPRIISQPTTLPQETSEFTRDVPLTRILRWACVELARLVSDRMLRIRVSDVAARFAGIADILPSWQMASQLSLTPAQRHFEPSFALAKLLLLGKSLVPGGGRVEIPGFAFVGWHVFQEYARRLLKEAVQRLGAEWRVERRTYLVGTPINGTGKLWCEPDFVITRRGRRIICLDAKYTRPMNVGQVPDSLHCAQVSTAARAVGAAVAVLLHPMPVGTGGDGRSWSLKGQGAPRILWLQPLRPATLMRQESHRAQVETIASRILEWAEDH